ncbi:quinone-dependent dihydroorotate dehydrogenase [Solimonas sp. K1W22B-7]|uniref:quinone-dependent dihydroorotate dehydrogenase n=1 Tax=Solimonas sp. K1W22B-7 TaxID=2303331 RepID=UPI000E32FD8B|nr:quinone-dependent dihydroorotate dehydrogenase [Solimonas sp. K1W22B-7]AXQ29370.1 quinone-dependent dihydroorotate dehydrogenase [Solimonas sp. K1W22B-7]
MLYSLARSALFQLDAERAHELTIASFRHLPRLATAPFAGRAPDDPVRLFGLNFPNRVGLAAGLDKNGECIEAWARLGFGFIEVGTVTPRPQPGNPKPRMFRLVEQQALINRLGFNNKGVDYLLRQVAQADYSGILGINIGKNADTPIERAADDYLICLRKVYQAASYVTVNISSPNTRNLRDLQDEAKLEALLKALKDEHRGLAQRHGKHTPMLVKIAPDVSPSQLDHIARLAVELGIDGLIATNTTLSRPGLEQEPLARQQGGLSGAPLESLACETLRQLRARVGKDYPLVGVGGICSGEDARARRRAGADLLQIYTGFIYQGPRLVAECAQGA